MPVKPKRPYLIRALNEWIVDSELTPHLMVDARAPDVSVPEDFVSEGKIVLNVSPTAVKDLQLGDDAISFSARFNGLPFAVFVPVGAVIAVYARETGEGMMFDDQESLSAEPAPGNPEASTGPDGPPEDDPDKPGGHLKLVT